MGIGSRLLRFYDDALSLTGRPLALVPERLSEQHSFWRPILQPFSSVIRDSVSFLVQILIRFSSVVRDIILPFPPVIRSNSPTLLARDSISPVNELLGHEWPKFSYLEIVRRQFQAQFKFQP